MNPFYTEDVEKLISEIQMYQVKPEIQKGELKYSLNELKKSRKKAGLAVEAASLIP
ncbi:MAG: hypothetical protein ABIJ31_13415 [Pseudomonadota bacterium]